MSGKIKIFLGHFPRIREFKRRETILLKFGPYSVLFVQNRPKFGRRIVRPLHFLFGHFWLMWPNNRPVGNTVYLGRARSEAVDDVGASLGAQHAVPDSRHRKVEQEEHWKTREYIWTFCNYNKNKMAAPRRNFPRRKHVTKSAISMQQREGGENISSTFVLSDVEIYVWFLSTSMNNRLFFLCACLLFICNTVEQSTVRKCVFWDVFS